MSRLNFVGESTNTRYIDTVRFMTVSLCRMALDLVNRTPECQFTDSEFVSDEVHMFIDFNEYFTLIKENDTVPLSPRVIKQGGFNNKRNRRRIDKAQLKITINESLRFTQTERLATYVTRLFGLYNMCIRVRDEGNNFRVVFYKNDFYKNHTMDHLNVERLEFNDIIFFSYKNNKDLYEQPSTQEPETQVVETDST